MIIKKTNKIYFMLELYGYILNIDIEKKDENRG